MHVRRETRCITPILVLIVAFAVLVGLIASFALMHPLDSQVVLVTLSPTSTAPPQLPAPALPIPTTVAEDVTSTASPTVVPQLPTPTAQPFFEGPFAYGTSFGGRPLLAYRFGTGPSARAIIGGIHGGYEWNTVVLISETLKYLQENHILIPDRVALYVIPCANPDGFAIGRGLEGRVNGNGVDLNRNWDYEWQETATHGTRPVKAGESAFSEPETRALRDLILKQDIEAAIFYHSAMSKIFYGAEQDKSATYELALVVSEATGYPIAAGVPGQITTGDAVDWMSAQGLAGIEVELTTHEDIELERNLRGLEAFLDWVPDASPTEAVKEAEIGVSEQGRSLEVTQVGNGDRVALVIIGGIHGDETNTEALVRDLMEQYTSAPKSVPPGFTLSFLPAMNPDGLAAGTRHNANNVDLNRNWPTDDWQADAARTRGVVPGSGGPAPGSEPEVQAVSRWLLDVIRPTAQEVWLLSYHSAYPPSGSVQPGYSIYDTPGSQADQLAQRVANISGYTYLPTWISEYTFTGELIHWCDLNGIWAADVELPSYEPPDTIPAGRSETTLATHQRVLSGLLASLGPDTALPDGDGYFVYTVQEGDTLGGIAFEFGVSQEEIMRLNNIEDEHLIVIGQELRIPKTMDDSQ